MMQTCTTEAHLPAPGACALGCCQALHRAQVGVQVARQRALAGEAHEQRALLDDGRVELGGHLHMCTRYKF